MKLLLLSLLLAIFLLALVLATERPKTYIYVGHDCKAGPMVLAEDDTDPALEACQRVDTHRV